jgi:hypothetical protein
MTLFEQCVDEARLVDLDEGYPDYPAITRAVLTCLLENTGSPRTVDEVTRVLGEAPAAGVYVA